MKSSRLLGAALAAAISLLIASPVEASPHGGANKADAEPKSSSRVAQRQPDGRFDSPTPLTTSDTSASEKREPTEPPEHFRIGPLIGLGFPRPLAVEAFAKVEKLVGVGFEYSFFPRTSVRNVDTGFNAFAVDLRLFPFRGAFFVGARVGRSWLDANAQLSAGQLGKFTESMQASTWFINPRAGVLFTFKSGITLGIDAGVQLPISPSYTRTGPATQAGLASQYDIDGTLVTVANALGNSTTPTIDLLRLGFLF